MFQNGGIYVDVSWLKEGTDSEICYDGHEATCMLCMNVFLVKNVTYVRTFGIERVLAIFPKKYRYGIGWLKVVSVHH